MPRIKKSAKNKNTTNKPLSLKQKSNVYAFIIDLAAAVLIVSFLNFIIIKILNLSPTALLEKGIETSLYEQKMQTLSYLGIVYIILISLYLAFLRKYFSLGNYILRKNNN